MLSNHPGKFGVTIFITNEKGHILSINSKAVLVGDLNMLRSFSDIKINTILVITDSDDVSQYSSQYDVCKILDIAELSDTEIVNELVLISQPFGERPILFYGDDRLLFIVSRNRDILEKYFKFLIPDPELVEYCTNKVRFPDLAKEHDLLIPKNIVFSGFNNNHEVETEVGFPCIIKPAVHIDWHESRAIKENSERPTKILLANNNAELDNWLDYFNENDELIIQEYIPGGEDAIYSFHTFADEESQPLAYFVGKKIRTYPSVGGVSTYVKLVHDEEVVRIGFETIKKLKVKGPVKIDFKKHAATKKYYILELNLRYNLWNYLGTVCGINIPMLAYRYLSNQPFHSPTEYKTNIRWLSFGDDFRSFVRYYRPEGQYTLWSWLRSMMHPKIYDVFSWNDPLPFIVAMVKYFKALFLRLSGR